MPFRQTFARKRQFNPKVCLIESNIPRLCKWHCLGEEKDWSSHEETVINLGCQKYVQCPWLPDQKATTTGHEWFHLLLSVWWEVPPGITRSCVENGENRSKIIVLESQKMVSKHFWPDRNKRLNWSVGRPFPLTQTSLTCLVPLA